MLKDIALYQILVDRAIAVQLGSIRIYMVNLFKEAKQGRKFNGTKDGFYLEESLTMGSGELVCREEFVRQVRDMDMRIYEKLQWLLHGSKKGTHQPVLTDSTLYNLCPQLIGVFTPPNTRDPDRLKPDWQDTRLGLLIIEKVSGTDLTQNVRVLDSQLEIWERLAAVRQVRKAELYRDLMASRLVKAQEAALSLKAYLEKLD